MDIIPNWHPLLVHFTIALYVISSLFFTAGFIVVKIKWKEKLISAAYINLWLGAVITVLTVIAGVYAYNTVDHDTPSHLAMTDHRNWALATAGLFWIVAIWSVFVYRAGKAVGLAFVIAMLVSSGLLGITGFKGGDIVYRYGLGVLSLPKPEGEGHDHSHEEGAAHNQGGSSAPAEHDDSRTVPHNHEEENPQNQKEPQRDDGHNHDH
ncbi:DUF2231 domain-containing protein [Paremcibacter congregatus]|uniref:DUF2231 domain-containing protein n=1 Tax=Paremcibacter congregatus TaxID=2043170 RepID=UPI0030EC6C5B|tara:strand:- start:15259 stop:15882 length:624 start_codon:yes stop_codon:yes gene_type:complete